MSPTLKARGIDHMTHEERFALVQEIWDSLADDWNPAPLSEAEQQELQRRLAGYEANPASAVPWEQVKADALARLRK